MKLVRLRSLVWASRLVASEVRQWVGMSAGVGTSCGVVYSSAMPASAWPARWLYANSGRGLNSRQKQRPD